jgi:hypothetical protein
LKLWIQQTTGLNLTETDVDVTPNDDKTGATVKAKDGSENFTGSVEVTFKVVAPVEKTDLSTIATKELGEFLMLMQQLLLKLWIQQTTV